MILSFKTSILFLPTTIVSRKILLHFIRLGSMRSNDLLKAQLQTIPLKQCNDTILALYLAYSIPEFKDGIDQSQVNIEISKLNIDSICFSFLLSKSF